MQIVLETERLVLRRFTADDVDNLIELDRCPPLAKGLQREILSLYANVLSRGSGG